MSERSRPGAQPASHPRRQPPATVVHADPRERDAVGLGQRTSEWWASRHLRKPPDAVAEVQLLCELDELSPRELRYIRDRGAAARAHLRAGRFLHDRRDLERSVALAYAVDDVLGERQRA